MPRPTIKFHEYSMDSADNKRRLMAQVGALRGPYRVALEPCNPQRSDPQRGWYFGVIVPVALAALRDAGWGDVRTEDDAHRFLAAQFLAVTLRNETTGQVRRWVRSTSDLTTEQFSAYCEDCRDLCTSLGHFVPDPDKNWREKKRAQSRELAGVSP